MKRLYLVGKLRFLGLDLSAECDIVALQKTVDELIPLTKSKQWDIVSNALRKLEEAWEAKIIKEMENHVESTRIPAKEQSGTTPEGLRN